MATSIVAAAGQDVILTAGTSISVYGNSLGYRVVNPDGTTGPEALVYADDDAVAAGQTFNLGSFGAVTTLEFFILQDGGALLTGDDQARVTTTATGASIGFEDLLADPALNPLGLVRDDNFTDVVFDVSFNPAPLPSRTTIVAPAGQDVIVTAGASVSVYGNSLGYRVVNADGTTGPDTLVYPDDDEVAVGQTFNLGRFVSDTTLEFFILQDGGPLLLTGSNQAVVTPGSGGGARFSFEDLLAPPASNPLGLPYDNNFTDVVFDVSFGTQPPSPSETTSSVGTLPDGSSVTVSLTAPNAAASSSVQIRIDVGAPVNSNVNVAYVIDTSGSTFDIFSGTATVPDQNGDGRANSILDAEIASLRALNASVVGNGFSSANIGLIEFNSTGRTVLTARAGADADGDGLSDISEALGTLSDGGSTNFEGGLRQAITFLNAAPDGTNFVYFLSDGFPDSTTAFLDEAATLRNSAGLAATIRAVGVGSGASLTALDLLDDNSANNSVQRVLTPASLTAELLGAPSSSTAVTSVDVVVNGTLVRSLAPSELTSTPLGLFATVDLGTLLPSADDTVQIVANFGGISVTTQQIIEDLVVPAPSPSADLMF